MNRLPSFEILLIILSIFIPLLFTLCKNLMERIAGKTACPEKEKIIFFSIYSGFYLHFFAIFIVFQLAKFVITLASVLVEVTVNSLYLASLIVYISLEDFLDKRRILIFLISIFYVIPFFFWTGFWVAYPASQAARLDETISGILCLFYLLLWLFFPVRYHPIYNLYRLLER